MSKAARQCAANINSLTADFARLRRERNEARDFIAKAAAVVADDRPAESPDRRDPKFLLARLESLAEDEREAQGELADLRDKNSLLIQTIERQRARERELLKGLREASSHRQYDWQTGEYVGNSCYWCGMWSDDGHAPDCIVKPAEEDPKCK